MCVIIDNFDSFTYNIVHAFQKLNQKVRVYRNTISLSEIFHEPPHYLVVGPGPGNPANAGISKQAILHAQKMQIPVLGICLGHQLIGEIFGGKVKRANRVMHGKTSEIFHSQKGIFQNLPQGFKVTRYHSLIVEQPQQLEVTAWTVGKEVMGLSHPKDPIFGVQFHPESVASECGEELLRNFLNIRTV